MLYTVSYFNPLANCDNVVHVEADSELEACLIAHAQFWLPTKEFDLSDYDAWEYSEEYIIRKENITKWSAEQLETAKKNAIKEYIKDNYKYYKDKMEDFLVECKEKLGIEPKEVYSIIEQLERPSKSKGDLTAAELENERIEQVQVPTPPKMKMVYEGFFGPKIDKILLPILFIGLFLSAITISILSSFIYQ